MDLRAFKIIGKAKSKLLGWARRREVPIHRIVQVASFEEGSKTLSVFVFYERDTDVMRCSEDGTSESIKGQYLTMLKKLRYPFDKFPKIYFTFDSHEQVEREYEGSYFFRTR